jgi:hypothetical protein
MFLGRRLKTIVVVGILSILFVPRAVCSQSSSTDADQIQIELSGMDKRGGTIERVREKTLAILQTQNGCTAWFREADADPAVVFRSLHYKIEQEKTSYVFRMTDGQGVKHFKQPWGARSTQYGGRNSNVGLNGNGAFFNSLLPVIELGTSGTLGRPGGFHSLTIASFEGNTTEAQITILLHELGHIIGRLPEDGDSWDGRSSLNTKEVLRHCEPAIRAAAHEGPRSGN